MNREGGAIPHAHTGGQNQGAPKVCQEWGVVWPCSQELRLISARARTRQPLWRRRLRPRRLHLLPEGSGAAAAEEARLLAPPLQGSPRSPSCFLCTPRRLRKNLKSLIIVHPSWFIRTVLAISRPFIR